MSCRVEGKLYHYTKIDCFSDGIRITLLRHGLTHDLEFGFPEFQWTFGGRLVRSVRLSPLLKSAILGQCKTWYERIDNVKENVIRN